MQTNNKMREALKDIGRLVEQIHFLYSDYPSEIHDIARKARAALAEPRSCANCAIMDADADGRADERIQRGVCDTSKLKKIEAGEYIYDGRYYITNVGYDRIHGHRVWSITDKNDKNCKRIAHGETLRGAVRLLQKILLGGKVVAE